MKKTIFLCLFPWMMTGCFEKEDVKPAVSQTQTATESKLHGTWTKTNTIIEYMDQAGKVVYKFQTADENGNKFEFNSGTLTFTPTSGNQEVSSYKIIESGASVGLIITEGTNSAPFNIAKLDARVLVIESAYDDLKYGSNQVAKSAKYIQNFAR